MSTVLNYPLVALASDYEIFGFLAAANNLWTWIAVISTAALSFWRIRASASSAIAGRVSEESLSPQSLSSREDEIVNADRSFPQPASCGAVEEEFDPGATTSPPPPPSYPTWFECDGGGVTKGKFATYYEEDRRDDEPPAVAATTVDEAAFGGGEWRWSWERAARLRDGERGWYSFQDLMVINGNVVRLWDERVSRR
ncbi:hypothetical protein ACJRO7_015902 [Eucalyptus globulus]|uniref:Uncharacterized protein n=1 Tax=Eucalyptus globulus TaxID=34317 RepID=A0ABD3L5P9_EUCGL